MKIRDFMIYPGPNLYSLRPMMKLIVDIGEYCGIPTKEIPGFHEKLLRAFPGLAKNKCSLGYEGGFLQRLKEGTYLAHVLEHVILEMQSMLGYDVRYGKTRQYRSPSEYYLVYEYQNKVCGLECGKAAVFLLNCFLNGEDPDVPGFLDYLQKIATDAELGPSTSAIVAEARKRGIPVTRIGDESLVRLGYGKHSRVIESTLTDTTSCVSVDISCNKQLTKTILSGHRIPVPYGKVVYSEISAVIAARQIGFPVVVKPFNANQGKGVFLNPTDEKEIKTAFREASKFSNGIIVEKFIVGKDYRILVVGDRVCAVSERRPAMVAGDGVHTVKELVDLVNRDERRGISHEKPLTRIRLDAVAINKLKSSHMTVDTVPKKGRNVLLRSNGNLSTGGTATDCTDLIHPDNARLAVLAAKVIGIDIAGIDMVTNDISKPISETGGAVVEVNTAPGIRMHLYPVEGKPRNVAKDIVDYLFPKQGYERFPIVSVTGTNGKTTTVRLIAHTLHLTGRTVGMTSTSGTFLDGRCIDRGDHSGPRSAKMLLSNPEIDCAVLETARGGIIREGLGYDRADVGVITNISEDHLGMDGIETVEDLAFVKSLVTEAVRENGFAVLNADDGMTPYLLERTRANVILFSGSGRYPDAYRSEKYVRIFPENGWVRLTDHGRKQTVIRVSDIPITCSGRIECNVENALAAVSALYALHVPLEVIAEGLKTFRQNEGRFHLYRLNGLHVMLDYGHNFSGYRQVIQACKNFRFSRLVGVIGMPGDREDSAIRKVGGLCSESFDEIYIKEDADKRGRKPLKVAGIFQDTVLSSGFPPSKVHMIENERDALQKAVETGRDGDLIVVFYESLEPLQQYLLSIHARPEPE